MEAFVGYMLFDWRLCSKINRILTREACIIIRHAKQITCSDDRCQKQTNTAHHYCPYKNGPAVSFIVDPSAQFAVICGALGRQWQPFPTPNENDVCPWRTDAIPTVRPKAASAGLLEFCTPIDRRMQTRFLVRRRPPASCPFLRVGPQVNATTFHLSAPLCPGS